MELAFYIFGIGSRSLTENTKDPNTKYYWNVGFRGIHKETYRYQLAVI